jgi:ABC-type glycerol-3-phosphate transport system substrate-binding protein
MSRQKRFLMMVTVFICITMSLVACAGPTPTPESIVKTVVVEKEGKTVVQTVVVEATAQPEEKESAEEFITLTFYSHRFTETPYGDVLRKQVLEYEGLHPNIKIQPIEVPTFERQAKLITMMQAGEVPDAIFIARDFGFYKPHNFLMDLEPFIEQEGGESFKAKFPEFVGPTVSDPSTGHWVALPAEIQFWTLFVNVDMFESGGIQIPEDRWWSWDEFKTAVDTLTHDDQYGYVARGKYPYREAGMWMLSHGGTYWGINSDCSNIDLLTPENIEAMQHYIELAKMGPPGFVEREYIDGIRLVGDQIAASIIDIPGGMNNAIQMSDNAISEMRPLYTPGSVKKRPMYTESWAIGKGSAHPEEAWEFIKWLNSDEKSLERMIGVGTLPATTSAMARIDEVDPQLVFMANLVDGAEAGCYEYFGRIGEMNQEETDAITRIFNGEDMTTVLKEVEMKLRELMAEG